MRTKHKLKLYQVLLNSVPALLKFFFIQIRSLHSTETYWFGHLKKKPPTKHYPLGFY